MIDFLYEGYGYDHEDRGMATLADQGVTGYDNHLLTEKANEYKAVDQFTSEHFSCYTDLRQAGCGCCKAAEEEKKD